MKQIQKLLHKKQNFSITSNETQGIKHDLWIRKNNENETTNNRDKENKPTFSRQNSKTLVFEVFPFIILTRKTGHRNKPIH